MSAETWTQERVERLTKLWADGFSCAQIAADIGGVSRNGVIGKIHRLRLTDPSYKQRRKPGPRPAPKPKGERKRQGDHHTVYKIVAGGAGSKRVIRSSASAEIIKLRCVEVDPLNLTFEQLGPDNCRFIYGDSPAEFAYCGHPQTEGSNYCFPHFQLTLGTTKNYSEEERALRRLRFLRDTHSSAFAARVTGFPEVA